MLALAMLMPVGAAIHQFGAALLSPMAVAGALAVAWQALFARLRKRAFGPDGALTGLAFALMASPSIPLWQLALALSFGVVMGEQIFGGR
ncbi:MAG: RnfABCDGE type electron transport complex subunit D, partial [Rubrivivax sp.]|nr:RnfABCDGE type electron transport complex subunit D [Rubrivivax sp.]